MAPLFLVWFAACMKGKKACNSFSVRAVAGHFQFWSWHLAQVNNVMYIEVGRRAHAPELVERVTGSSGRAKVSSASCSDAFCGSKARWAPFGGCPRSEREHRALGGCEAGASPHLVVTPSSAGGR